MPGRVDDYRDGPSDPSTEEVLEAGLRSGIAAPLWARGRLWGALTAGSELPSAFGAGDERRLQAFAELTAIAVANAETRAELAHLADTDPLTGLANRRAFRERLDGEVMRAQRHGHLLTLAIIDIDDFKGINDTYGHLGGDAVLAEIGRRLAATRRAGELVARIGGEEFAWILPQVDATGRAGGRRARATGDRGDLGRGHRGGHLLGGDLRSDRGGRRGRAAAAGRPGPLPGQGRGPRPGGVGRPLTVRRRPRSLSGSAGLR